MTEAPTNDFALLLLANRDRFHSGFGFRARLENLALSDDNRGGGRRLLRDNRASLRRSVLDDVELLSLGQRRRCNDHCKCSKNYAGFHWGILHGPLTETAFKGTGSR
jgi:hypothetical protein